MSDLMSKAQRIQQALEAITHAYEAVVTARAEYDAWRREHPEPTVQGAYEDVMSYLVDESRYGAWQEAHDRIAHALGRAQERFETARYEVDTVLPSGVTLRCGVYAVRSHAVQVDGASKLAVGYWPLEQLEQEAA